MNAAAHDELPVSGRSQPRPALLPEGFAHDVKFTPLIDGETATTHLLAWCAPCGWRRKIFGTHDVTDFTRLVNQHSARVCQDCKAAGEPLSLFAHLLKGGVVAEEWFCSDVTACLARLQAVRCRVCGRAAGSPAVKCAECPDSATQAAFGTETEPGR